MTSANAVQPGAVRTTMDDALAALDAELSSIDPAALASADGAMLAAACARVATAALDSARPAGVATCASQAT